MIRVRQVKVLVSEKPDIKAELIRKLKIKESDIIDYKIHKQSLDCRKKPILYYIYEIDVNLKDEKKILNKQMLDVLATPCEQYSLPIAGVKELRTNPIIVGAGPAGLFAAYILALAGYKPVIYERGEKIEDRIKSVDEFWSTGQLNKNSNVQFGEGGAGTFSDGKLNTLIKDERHLMRFVYETFVECGAPKEILYLNKPHIGTDVLRNIVINMRNKIIELGGKIHYNFLFKDFETVNNKLTKIKINDTWMDCETLILAIGHSARDTFELLFEKNMNMQAKPFAVGIRIEHPQEMINENQYGKNYPNFLPPAEYKLAYTTKQKRGVYSFCMCPGGFVVNASSEDELLVVNGMSNHARDTKNANSAIIVTVTPDDFGHHPLAGVKFQRELEHKAYLLGKGKIPMQRFGDYINDQTSIKLGNIEPITKGNTSFANLNDLFPKYINESLKEGITNFENKIKGFSEPNSLMFGVEARTSSPIKIIRNENFISNIDGIYPCGEGAGYAGGITSSAMDGIKVAEKIIQTFKSKED